MVEFLRRIQFNLFFETNGIIFPINTWFDKSGYRLKAKELRDLFIQKLTMV